MMAHGRNDSDRMEQSPADFGAMWTANFGKLTGDEPMNAKIVEDFDADVAARHLLDACGGSPQKIALAAGRSPRTGRRYANGDRSSPMSHLTRILKRAANPWHVVAYVIALVLRKEITDDGFLAEWAWRQQIREALHEQQGPDGTEDEVSQLFLCGEASPMDLFNAFSRFLAVAFRVAALALYGGMMGYTLTGSE